MCLRSCAPLLPAGAAFLGRNVLAFLHTLPGPRAEA